MKKFFFLGLAAMMAFTSCTKDETLATAQNGAINFVASADKATRSNVDPSTTTDNIKNFTVYGFMNEATGVVFDDELVTGSNSAGWTYGETQYWTPNTYYFAALAPGDKDVRKWTLTEASGDSAKLGVGTIEFTNEGKQDLLYWAGISENKNGESEDKPVAITFNHLLSKVKFSFVNEFDNENTTITVKNVQIENGYTKGSVNLAVADWWSVPAWTFDGATADFVHKFGNVTAVDETDATKCYNIPALAKQEGESHEELLLFPVSNKSFKITFTVELWNGQVIAATYDHTVFVETTLEMGKAYDFKAKLNSSNVTGSSDPEDQLKPIEFEVEVKDWEEPNEVVVYEEYSNKNVAAGETLTLSCNGTIKGSMNLAGTLDGNNHTLYGEVVPTNNGLIRPTGEATIKNVTIDGKNGVTADGKTIRGLYINKDVTKVTVDNVKILNCGYALNVGGESTPAALELFVSNSTFQSWTSYGETTTAAFEEVAFTAGQYARFRPYGTTTLTNCTFEEGFIIDLAYLGEGKTITFNGCKVGDVALTAAHLTGAVDGTYTIN